ncbi:kinase-like domain-containing protein [Hypoxylon trugodes]|uniref:kinase-like domain-containing protein n=1 Tax=Hypoxylon trugodes TaxID=326681 RepID=UPI00219A95AD|nr:kinase-like domain-containing protein [Hypoxylon trugodes]KAI1389424.1 kinase-like domain-containing protein [Hypoxylon trugodes]
MATLATVPELVRDSRLETKLIEIEPFPRLTVHEKPHDRRSTRKEAWIRKKPLGRGGYGNIWLEQSVEGSHTPYQFRAVKELNIVSQKGRTSDYQRELEALAKFSQEKFVRFFVKSFGWFEASDTLYIAMEYHENGDLRNYLARHGKLPESQVQDITWQIVQGVLFMHENGFAHRDLKPANILINTMPPSDDWWVKICDLGLSKRIEGEVESTTAKGTPGFMPPELVPGFAADVRNTDPFKADIWCLGETTFYMFTCQTTFGNSQLKMFEYLRGSLQFPSQPLETVGASENAMDFLCLLMKARPSTRPTAAQANKHPWLLGVSNSTPLPLQSMKVSSSTSLPCVEDADEPSGEWTITGPADVPSSFSRVSQSSSWVTARQPARLDEQDEPETAILHEPRLYSSPSPEPQPDTDDDERGTLENYESQLSQPGCVKTTEYMPGSSQSNTEVIGNSDETANVDIIIAANLRAVADIISGLIIEGAITSPGRDGRSTSSPQSPPPALLPPPPALSPFYYGQPPPPTPLPVYYGQPAPYGYHEQSQRLALEYYLRNRKQARETWHYNPAAR